LGLIILISLQSCYKENRIFDLEIKQEYPLQKLIKTDTNGVIKENPNKTAKE